MHGFWRQVYVAYLHNFTVLCFLASCFLIGRW